MNKKSMRRLLILLAILGSFLIINASTGSAITWGELTPRLECMLISAPDSWSADIISKINLTHNRLAYIAQNPLPNLWISPEVVEQALGILDRITALLINPQPEPPIPQEVVVQGFNVLDRVSWILINPQPEPPALPEELMVQGFNVLDRVSWILINPQPEPPALPQKLIMQALEIMYRVSGVILRAQIDYQQDLKVPAFNALERLSSHLLVSKKGSPANSTSAHLNAMYKITRLYLAD